MRFELTEEDELVLTQIAERIAPWVTGPARWMTLAMGILLAVLAGILLAASPLRDYPFLFVGGVMLWANWYAGRLTRRWFGS